MASSQRNSRSVIDLTVAKPSRLSNFHIRRNILRRTGRELRHCIDSELGKLTRRMDNPPSMEGFIRTVQKSSFGQMTINDLLQSIYPPIVKVEEEEPMPQPINLSIVKVEEEEEPIYPSIVKVEEEEEEEPMPQSIYPSIARVEEEEEPMMKEEEDMLENVLASLTNTGYSSDLPVDLTTLDFNSLMDLSFTI